MKAFVLCAGLGTRMRPLSYYIHKCMMPLADGRPLLDHVTEYLCGNDIDPIICLSEGNHEKQVIENFKDSFLYSVAPRPLGTAGEVWHAAELLDDSDETFIVYYGDTLTDINLRRLMAHHRAGNYDMTTCAVRGVKSEYGILRLNGDGSLKALDEKPVLEHLRHLPVYVCSRKVLDYCGEGRDFAKDVFPDMLRDGRRIGVYIHDGRYLDIGRLSDYEVGQ